MGIHAESRARDLGVWPAAARSTWSGAGRQAEQRSRLVCAGEPRVSRVLRFGDGSSTALAGADSVGGAADGRGVASPARVRRQTLRPEGRVDDARWRKVEWRGVM